MIGLWIAVITLAALAGGMCGRLGRRIAALEAALDRPRRCTHPDVENEGTFGQPVYRCVACRARVEGLAE